MTEKEKTAAGLLYDANYDPEIVSERTACHDLCFRYNALPPSAESERTELLGRILGAAGEGLHIESPFYCDLGRNIRVGRNFYANFNLVVLDEAPVTFGNDVFIAPGCGFHTAGHPLDAAQRRRGLEYARPITVGDDVWIGAGVQVCPGVTIGSNVVIGAGSVVTRDIPSDCVAYGNPCRVARRLVPSAGTAGDSGRSGADLPEIF